MDGAAITGIGQAVFEEIVYDNGQLINPNLVDYVLPSLNDMPLVIDSIAIEIPDKNGPFGAKGIGESELIPVAPAIANAIFDAVGVRIRELPIRREKLLAELDGAGGEAHFQLELRGGRPHLDFGHPAVGREPYHVGRRAAFRRRGEEPEHQVGARLPVSVEQPRVRVPRREQHVRKAQRDGRMAHEGEGCVETLRYARRLLEHHVGQRYAAAAVPAEVRRNVHLFPPQHQVRAPDPRRAVAVEQLVARHPCAAGVPQAQRPQLLRQRQPAEPAPLAGRRHQPDDPLRHRLPRLAGLSLLRNWNRSSRHGVFLLDCPALSTRSNWSPG